MKPKLYIKNEKGRHEEYREPKRPSKNNMTKIVYFKPYIDSVTHYPFDAYAMEKMNDAEVFDCITKHPKDVAIYNTFEDFAEAFNNGYISDEGWIRTIKYENT